MFGFVICVSESVVVISRCKIDFFNYWVVLGHGYGARGAGLELKKKTCLLNRPGSGYGKRPSGQVQALKNLT